MAFIQLTIEYCDVYSLGMVMLCRDSYHAVYVG